MNYLTMHACIYESDALAKSERLNRLGYETLVRPHKEFGHTSYLVLARLPGPRSEKEEGV